MPSINSQELHDRMQSGETLNLLDVREEIEFHTYNIGGKNIPLSKVNENINKLGYNKSEEIIVICKAGLRSQTATDLLTRNGFIHVRNLTGGLMALQKFKQQTH